MKQGCPLKHSCLDLILIITDVEEPSLKLLSLTLPHLMGVMVPLLLYADLVSEPAGLQQQVDTLATFDED